MSVGSGDAGHYAVEALCRSGGSEHVRCIAGSGGLALEVQLKWFEEFLLGVPMLVPYWFVVPDGAVAREVVSLEKPIRRESGEHVVCDQKLGAHQFLLGLLHVDDKLCHAQVGLPQFVEAGDEFYPRRPVQARAVLLEVFEDFSDRDAGVKCPGDAQLLDPRRFNVGQDEVSSTYLDCANAALVGRPGCPSVLHPSYIGETIVLQNPSDVWVVVRAHVAH